MPTLSHIVVTSSTASDHSYSHLSMLSNTIDTHEEQLRIFKNGIELNRPPPEGLLATQDYVIDATALEVQLDNPLIASDTLVIMRQTRADKLIVKFTSAARLSAEDMNLYTDQVILLIQEADEVLAVSIALGETVTLTPSTNRDKYTVVHQGITNATLSYAGIEMLPNDRVPHSSQLVVSENDVVQTLTTDYTVDAAAETITLVVTPIVADNIEIERTTSRTRHVPAAQVLNASSLSSDHVGLNFDQIRLLTDEIPFVTGLGNSVISNRRRPRRKTFIKYSGPGDRFYYGNLPFDEDASIFVWVNDVLIFEDINYCDVDFFICLLDWLLGLNDNIIIQFVGLCDIFICNLIGSINTSQDGGDQNPDGEGDGPSDDPNDPDPTTENDILITQWGTLISEAHDSFLLNESSMKIVSDSSNTLASYQGFPVDEFPNFLGCPGSFTTQGAHEHRFILEWDLSEHIGKNVTVANIDFRVLAPAAVTRLIDIDKMDQSGWVGTIPPDLAGTKVLDTDVDVVFTFTGSPVSGCASSQGTVIPPNVTLPTVSLVGQNWEFYAPTLAWTTPGAKGAGDIDTTNQVQWSAVTVGNTGTDITTPDLSVLVQDALDNEAGILRLIFSTATQFGSGEDGPRFVSPNSPNPLTQPRLNLTLINANVLTDDTTIVATSDSFLDGSDNNNDSTADALQFRPTDSQPRSPVFIFDVSSMEAVSYTSVHLRLNYDNNQSTDTGDPIFLSFILQNIVIAECTRIIYSTGNNWNTIGGEDSVDNDHTTRIDWGPTYPAPPYSIGDQIESPDLTVLVNQALADNNGLLRLIMYGDSNIAQTHRYESLESGDATQHPRLIFKA